MALTRKERTLGCLWAMACGDALGVPSSFLTPEQIKSKYGWIDTFYPPEKGHIFHDGLLAGEYTDDTEQSMALMNAYIRDKKVVPMSVVKEIIAWADRVKDKYASPLGPSTERALKKYQKARGLKVDGVLGAETRRTLAEDGYEMPAWYPEVYPEGFERTLKKGMRGMDVRAVQEKLIEKGYLTGRADHIYGNKTRNAVKKFQEDNNLRVTGICNPQTLFLLMD